MGCVFTKNISKEIVSKEIVSNEMVSNEMVSNKMISNEMGSNKMISNKMISNEMISKEMGSNQVVANGDVFCEQVCNIEKVNVRSDNKEIEMPDPDRIPDKALSLDRMFSLTGSTVIARVIGVHDGDTITCIIFCNNLYVKFKIRLAHIDTAEMNTRPKNDGEIKKVEQLILHSVKAKARLIDLITDGKISIDNVKRDKKYENLINDQIREMNCLVKIKITKYESKFGRQLGEIYRHNDMESKSFSSKSFSSKSFPSKSFPSKSFLLKSFNQILLDENLAIEYSGGTKLTLDEQIERFGLAHLV